MQENMPVDLRVLPGRWKGFRVTIEAQNMENLRAKIQAFNAMIEAQGYGPDANKQ